MDNYYTDNDIDYQLYYLCSENTFDDEKPNRIQIYEGTQEEYDKMLENVYPSMMRNHLFMLNTDEKYSDDSVGDFLKQHKDYISNRIPHILL